VAKGEAAIERGVELVLAHVLAAHDPIVVEQANLDVAQVASLNYLPRIACRFDISWAYHNLNAFF
ncbi:MAG: hypothetical protein ACI87W_002662, partial [Halieaceae bacterium]